MVAVIVTVFSVATSRFGQSGAVGASGTSLVKQCTTGGQPDGLFASSCIRCLITVIITLLRKAPIGSIGRTCASSKKAVGGVALSSEGLKVWGLSKVAASGIITASAAISLVEEVAVAKTRALATKYGE